MIRVNQDLAYWIGVLQTDGSLYKDKRIPNIGFGVSKKSLPMLQKFSRITNEVFGRLCKIDSDKRGYYHYDVSVKRLLETFRKLGIVFGDPPSPPEWIQKNPYFFAPYLAGVIDGDGDVRVKRPKYPQCAIRITSGSKPKLLISSISYNLRCAVGSSKRSRVSYLDGRMISGMWWATEFYVSRKNKEFVKEKMLPHMTISHKVNKIEDFIEKR